MNIDRVKIQNFKSLVDVNLELRNLTILTGVNSSGKSSFIQSLLLFKENIDNIIFETTLRSFLAPERQREVPTNKLSINGTYVNMGEAKAILSQESTSFVMMFEIGKEQKTLSISIDPDMNINCPQLPTKDSPQTFDNFYKDMNFQSHTSDLLQAFDDKCFDYLSTDRAPPALTFPFSKNINNNSIGIRGEYSTHFLAEHRHQALSITQLKHSESKTVQLLENVEKWLGEISPNILIKPSADASIQSSKLIYQYAYKNTTGSEYSSLNVGFGLTYVLPVIVLILKAKPNDLLIIENPESHLHPAGQSKIAELCAIACANGVQIIIETHSDHFINGIRVATKQKTLSPNQSQVYYFKKDQNELESKIDKININEDGGIDSYPKGFFDEFDNNLDKLLW